MTSVTLTELSAKEHVIGKAIRYASVSVDGYIANQNDDPEPFFDWLLNGDVPLDESDALNVSQVSFDYIRPYWDSVSLSLAAPSLI